MDIMILLVAYLVVIGVVLMALTLSHRSTPEPSDREAELQAQIAQLHQRIDRLNNQAIRLTPPIPVIGAPRAANLPGCCGAGRKE
jgi:hypothetical protein